MSVTQGSENCGGGFVCLFPFSQIPHNVPVPQAIPFHLLTIEIPINMYHHTDYRETDGLTSWVPPPGSTGGSASVEESVPEVLQSHIRNKTELPDNWGKDTDGEGNTYYYEKSTNETMWEPPPGSKKGDICF